MKSSSVELIFCSQSLEKPENQSGCEAGIPITHTPQLFMDKQSADDQCYGHYKLPDHKSFPDK